MGDQPVRFLRVALSLTSVKARSSNLSSRYVVERVGLAHGLGLLSGRRYQAEALSCNARRAWTGSSALRSTSMSDRAKGRGERVDGGSVPNMSASGFTSAMAFSVTGTSKSTRPKPVALTRAPRSTSRSRERNPTGSTRARAHATRSASGTVPYAGARPLQLGSSIERGCVTRGRRERAVQDLSAVRGDVADRGTAGASNRSRRSMLAQTSPSASRRAGSRGPRRGAARR